MSKNIDWTDLMNWPKNNGHKIDNRPWLEKLLTSFGTEEPVDMDLDLPIVKNC